MTLFAEGRRKRRTDTYLTSSQLRYLMNIDYKTSTSYDIRRLPVINTKLIDILWLRVNDHLLIKEQSKGATEFVARLC